MKPQESLKVTEAKFRDLSLMNKTLFPGQFSLEIHYDYDLALLNRENRPNYPFGMQAPALWTLAMHQWNSHVFGKSACDSDNFFPGILTSRQVGDRNLQAFMLVNYTDPAVEAKMATIEDPEKRERAETQRQEQIDLKTVLSAPSVPIAITTKMFVQMIEAGKLDSSAAIENLQNNFSDLGDHAARELIKRGLQLLADRQLLR